MSSAENFTQSWYWTHHDNTWCPHSCNTAQKVFYQAPILPEILAGALCKIRGLVKEEYLMILLGYFSTVFHKKIHYWYSLELSQWGKSNKYPQYFFQSGNSAEYQQCMFVLWRNTKNYPTIITKYSWTICNKWYYSSSVIQKGQKR